MINNHKKSCNTHLSNHRDDFRIMHGFFMANRRLRCPDEQERRIVIDIEKIKEIII